MSTRRVLPLSVRLSLFSRSAAAAVVAVAATLGVVASSPGSPITFSASGTSALGHPLAVSAAMTFGVDTLTIVLSNTSPVDTTDAADVLTSFYFDIQKTGTAGIIRPNLSYVSGTGNVFLVQSGDVDMPYYWNPSGSSTFALPYATNPSNLTAVNPFDATWQYRSMNSGSAPYLGFGIGTVGNSNLSPNGFTPEIVGPSGNSMINYGIYRGADINPNGILNFKFLVRDSGTFTFAGLSTNGGFTEADTVDGAVFGFGTAPDSTFVTHLPEPPVALGAAGALAGGTAVLTRRRRRAAAA